MLRERAEFLVLRLALRHNERTISDRVARSSAASFRELFAAYAPACRPGAQPGGAEQVEALQRHLLEGRGAWQPPLLRRHRASVSLDAALAAKPLAHAPLVAALAHATALRMCARSCVPASAPLVPPAVAPTN